MRRLLTLAAFLFLSSHAALLASVVHIDPTARAVLNADLSPVDPAQILAPGLLAPRVEPYLIEVDVNVRTDGLGGDKVGFANTAFDVQINGQGAAYSDFLLGVVPWNRDRTQVDINGDAPGGIVNKWDYNTDEGGYPFDLLGILVAGVTKNFGPVQFDIRRTLTQGDGDYAGTFYIVLPGIPGASTSADILAPYGASTYNADGVADTAGNESVGGSTERYSVVPEPSTLALLGLGSALLVFARKRR